MHEMSIAGAILESLERIAPPNAIVRAVTVRAGPMRAIDAVALNFAWRVAREQTRFAEVELELHSLPWHLRCPVCGGEFEAPELYTPCPCGVDRACPIGGEELDIVSLSVDDPSLIAAGGVT